MDRRQFVKFAGVAGMQCAASGPVPKLGRRAAKGPRQAIILLGESVRYDMLNCNRATGLETPNLDRIAAKGVSFERAYNCQPVCAPARSALWTGLWPHTSGVWGNSMPLGDTTHTLGQRLTDQGLHSAFIGKWHLSGTDYFDTGRPAPGWDPHYWYDMHDYLEELSPEDRLRSRRPATGLSGTWPAEKCYGHRVTERALDFLEKHGTEDFLLVVSYDEPHHPWLCPLEYTKKYERFTFPSAGNFHDALTTKPEEQRVWAGPRLHGGRDPIEAPQFFGAHTFIDHQIGRILDSIEQHCPSALLIYTSDHGVFLGNHGLADKGPAMYDEITRVPFLVRWPGHAPANMRSRSLVSHINVCATIMDFFGFDVPKVLEGRSVLALFETPALSVQNEVFLEWGRYEVDHDGFGALQPIRCICDGRHKLSVHLMTSDELYDLQTDPGEMNNLIDSAEHAGVRLGLHDRLLRWMDESRDPFRGYYWGHRAWRRDFPVRWAGDGHTRQREEDGYLPRELDYDTGLRMTSATRLKT